MKTMSKFLHCFPSDDGNIICQHPNGNWIVFPAYSKRNEENTNEKTSSKIEEILNKEEE